MIWSSFKLFWFNTVLLWIEINSSSSIQRALTSVDADPHVVENDPHGAVVPMLVPDVDAHALVPLGLEVTAVGALWQTQQVCLQTQFYSVDFSLSRIGVKECVVYKHTIKVCVRCCWRCPGTSPPSGTHLTVSLFPCSSGSSAWGESRALEECHVSSKSPIKCRRRRHGSCWEERKRMAFPRWGVIGWQINDFFTKQIELEWVRGQTWYT